MAEPWTVNGAEVPFGDILRQDETEFPEGFTGAGPMFAAVPLGERWLDVATSGATTYILHDPYSFRGPEEQVQQLHERYAGFSAFLDRDQAEQIADHPARSGEFYRWEGLTGVPDCTARREAEIAEDVDWVSQLDGFFPEAS